MLIERLEPRRLLSSSIDVLADIIPGPSGSRPSGMVAVNDRVVFVATDETHGRELWSTDGTPEGTQLIKDFIPAAPTRDASIMLYPDSIVGGRALFAAYSEDVGYELWATDGTAEGTVLVRDITPGPTGTRIDHLPFMTTGGKLYFRLEDPTIGTELWTSDGTEAGTYLVADINPGSESSSPLPMAALGDKLIFQALHPEHGFELWVTDGTQAGTRLVKDIIPGTGWGVFAWPNREPMTRYAGATGNHVLFMANASNENNDAQLWATDGTETGTYLVHHHSGVGSLNGYGLLGFWSVGDDAVIYSVNGDGMWRSDGTAEGTFKLPTGSNIAGDGTALGNMVVFTSSHEELWATDGTLAGTERIATFSSRLNYSIRELQTVGNFVYFEADDVRSSGLWRTDGTANGTTFLGPIYESHAAAEPILELALVNQNVIFGSTIDERGDELLTVPTSLPLIARAGPDALAEEGIDVALSASGSLGDIVSYEWDFNYGGYAFNTMATGMSSHVPGSQLDGDGIQWVGLRVTDTDGNTAIDTRALIVSNVAPSATLVNSGPVAAGSTATVSFADLADPSAYDLAHLFYQYDFDNDGSMETLASDESSAMIPAEYLLKAGPHTVRAIVSDGSDWIERTTTIEVTGPEGLITGTLFSDWSADGTRNNSESALLYWTVFVDADLDGVLDAGEKSAISNGHGAYFLAGLLDGTYRVRVAARSNWNATAPAMGWTDVVVIDGATVSNVNFGYRQAASVIIDNPQATLTGTWSSSTRTPGYHGADYLHDANAAKGSKSVAWQPFLPGPGKHFVYARWIAGADRASNARYTISHKHGISTAYADQRTKGGEWVQVGESWFEFWASTSDSITLHNEGTNGFVIADAVRFVRAEAPLAPTDLSANALSSTTVRLTWTDRSDNELWGFQVQRRVVDSGYNFASIATVAENTTSFDDMTAQAGTAYEYRVVAMNQTGTSNPTNVATITTPRAPPPVETEEIIIDNAAATLTGAWASSTRIAGFYGADYLHDIKTGKGTKSVRWTPNIGTAGTFAVYARWISGADRASNVPIDITHSGGTSTVTVDQRANGGSWQLLGNFTFDAGTGGNILLRTTGTTGFVIADAVRLVRLARPPIEVIADNSSASIAGTWSTSTRSPGYHGSNYLHDGSTGKGSKAVTWTDILQEAGTYKVYGRWISGADRADNARYEITHNAGTSTIYADQRTSGSTWVLLGEFTFTAGSASITLSNTGTSGYVIADAVRWVKA